MRATVVQGGTCVVSVIDAVFSPLSPSRPSSPSLPSSSSLPLFLPSFLSSPRACGRARKYACACFEGIRAQHHSSPSTRLPHCVYARLWHPYSSTRHLGTGGCGFVVTSYSCLVRDRYVQTEYDYPRVRYMHPHSEYEHGRSQFHHLSRSLSGVACILSVCCPCVTVGCTNMGEDSNPCLYPLYCPFAGCVCLWAVCQGGSCDFFSD